MKLHFDFDRRHLKYIYRSTIEEDWRSSANGRSGSVSLRHRTTEPRWTQLLPRRPRRTRRKIDPSVETAAQIKIIPVRQSRTQPTVSVTRGRLTGVAV